MKKLQSQIDYENSIDLPSLSDSEFRLKIAKHRVFLTKPLELGMFFPFDSDGNFMIEPKAENYFNVNIPIDKLTEEDQKGASKFHSAILFYEDAMKKVLFKDFIIENGYIQANRDTLYLTNQDGLDIASKNETHDKHFIWDVGFETIEDLIPYNLTLTVNVKI